MEISMEEEEAEEEVEEAEATAESQNIPMDTGDDVGGVEDSEDEEDDSGSALGMEDRENEDWMNEDSDPNEGDIEEEEEDADVLEKYDMYGL